MTTLPPKVAFKHQRWAAKKRGIAWEFTFPQWWSVWCDSGKWEQRGRGQGYVMCRKGDVGPYAAGNILIALQRENSSWQRNKKKNLPMGVFQKPGRKTFQACRRIYGKKVRLGTYSTSEEAHAAYLAAGEGL